MDREVSEWDRCRKFLEPSIALHLATGGHTLEDYAAGVRAGYFQLWPGIGAAVITGTSYTLDGECVNVLVGGGDLAELREIYDRIEAMARDGGAVGIMLIGRYEWRRDMKARGMDHISSVFYKRLEH